MLCHPLSSNGYFNVILSSCSPGYLVAIPTSCCDKYFAAFVGCCSIQEDACRHGHAGWVDAWPLRSYCLAGCFATCASLRPLGSLGEAVYLVYISRMVRWWLHWHRFFYGGLDPVGHFSGGWYYVFFSTLFLFVVLFISFFGHFCNCIFLGLS